jgi:glycosyltransferase involved in cell wall biosynthesis
MSSSLSSSSSSSSSPTSRKRSSSSAYLTSEEVSKFLLHHLVGSFWIPTYLTIWVCSPTQTHVDSHFVALVTLSFSAHLFYAWAGAIAKRNAANMKKNIETLAAEKSTSSLSSSSAKQTLKKMLRVRGRMVPTIPDELRVLAGFSRWICMPIIAIHALLAHSLVQQSIQPEEIKRSIETSSLGTFFTMLLNMLKKSDGKPIFEFVRVVRFVFGESSFVAADSIRKIALERLGIVWTDSNIYVQNEKDLLVPWYALPLTAPSPFLVVLFAFLLFRTLQVILWYFATPPTPERVSKDGLLTGDAAAEAAIANPHLYPGGEFNAARLGKLRIMVIGDSMPPKVDGVSIRIGHLSKKLSEAGHAMHLITSIRSWKEPLNGAEVTQLPGYVSSWYKEHSFSIPTPQIFYAIFKFKPHVIHILDEGYIQVFAQLIASLFLIPTVFSHHSHIDKFVVSYVPALNTLNFATNIIQILRRLIGAQADVHLAVGTEMQIALEKAGCGPLIGQWACGVDVDSFNPMRRMTGMEEGGLRWRLTGGRPHIPIVAYCGRLAPEKKLEHLPNLAIELAILLSNEKKRQKSLQEGQNVTADINEPVVAIVVVGGGPVLAPLKVWFSSLGPTYAFDPDTPFTNSENDQIKDLNSNSTVEVFNLPPATTSVAPPNSIVGTFCGQVNHGATLGSIYATADAFFSPSDVETLGQVFQEAMASGTVPVGAAAAGVLEVMTHEREGYHYPYGDMKTAATFVVRAIEDRKSAPTFGTPGAYGENSDAVSRLGTSVRERHISELGREKVLKKSWNIAFEQALTAYGRAMGTRWYYQRTRNQ